MEGDLEVTTGLRGQTHLCLNGYIYTKQTVGTKTIRWRCNSRTKFQCSGAVSTSNELPYSNPSNFKDHSHAPDDTTKEVTKVRRELREASLGSDARPIENLASTLREIPDEVKSQLCNQIRSVQRDIRKYRQRALLPLPKSVSEPEIPADWQAAGGEDSRHFLIQDGGLRNERSDPGSTSTAVVETPYVSSDIKAEPLDIIDDYDGQNDEDQEFPTVDPLLLDNASDKSLTADGTDRSSSSSFMLKKFDTAEDNEQLNKNYIDEDKAFLLSLLPAMKELTGEKKMEFKMVILEQLRRLRYPNNCSPNDLSNVTVLPVQNFGSLGPSSPAQPAPLTKENVQIVAANTGRTVRALSSGKKNMNPSEASRETTPKTVQQKRQPKPKSTPQPARKRQKLNTETQPTKTETAYQLDPVPANIATPAVMNYLPVLPKPTITAMLVEPTGERVLVPDHIVEEPELVQSTSGSTLDTYVSPTRVTGSRRTIDRVQETGEIAAGVVDSTNEPIETEIDVDEIKIEHIKVEPYVEFDGSDTET